MPWRLANAAARSPSRLATATTRWSVFACTVVVHASAITPGARIPQRSAGPPRSGAFVGSGRNEGRRLTGVNLAGFDTPLRGYSSSVAVRPCQQLVDGVRGDDALGGDPVLLG